MNSKTTVQNFIKYVRELSQMEYVKHIGDPKNCSLNMADNKLSSQVDFPDDMMLYPFVVKFRDFFQKDSYYCIRRIRAILNDILPADKEIFEIFNINENWWRVFQENSKLKITIEPCENDASSNKKQYHELYDVYNDYLYAFYLHNDPDKRERLELPFTEIIAKPFFYLFLDYGFQYLYKLECILTLANYRKCFDPYPRHDLT
jgi:hypothetical protein